MFYNGFNWWNPQPRIRHRVMLLIQPAKASHRSKRTHQKYQSNSTGMSSSVTSDGRSEKHYLRRSGRPTNADSPNERSLVNSALPAPQSDGSLRQESFRNAHHGGSDVSWIPFVSIWRSAGQRAATMHPNSAASCVNAAMVDSEAG